MKVLIVGGTGFIGYHAVHEMIRRGHQVSILSLPPLPQEGLFPQGVSITLADLNALSDEGATALLKGHDAVIFAAGADDRVTPKAPAYEFFFNANVKAAARFFSLARKAGVKRGVLLSSYFAYFDRAWPEYRLADHHPYIRSRREQEAESLRVSLPDLELLILELPYIFGSMPGRKPLWAPLVDYLRMPVPLFYTQGGTNVVSVERVAEAIAGALERGTPGERYVVGDRNMTWQELIGALARLAGRPRKVRTVPNWMLGPVARMIRLYHHFQGKEGGLDPVAFMQVQTARTYFDPEPARQVLGFGRGGIEEALRKTVEACPEKAKGNR